MLFVALFLSVSLYKTGVLEKIEQPRKVAWCGCKLTKTPPFCDGSHTKL